MIDIHTHILPGVDDGATTMEEALDMAKHAVESGIHTLVVTPHCNRQGIENFNDSVLEDKFHYFQYRIQKENIPLKILYGMEVYGTEEVPTLLKRGKLASINNSRYLLIEFDFLKDLSLVDYVLNEVLDQGYVPIIAHPERYPFVQKHPDIVYEWMVQGCTLQINKGSILGSFGNRARDTSFFLLERGLASFVASDAHNCLHRNVDMRKVRNMVASHFSSEYADCLLEANPMRVIQNKPLVRRRA